VPVSTQSPITAANLEKLRAEVAELETTSRAEIANALKLAASDGDLKENAEYHACREAQAHLEARIASLLETIRNSTVVAESTSTEVVAFGSTVTFTDKKSASPQTFRIVSSREANPTQGTLSAESPVARALDGHRVGETISVRTPAGEREFTITELR
jgi:transcription elongation factor GreA